MPETQTKKGLTMIAHRGACMRYPENTLIAFQTAVDAGAKFIELDVQLSSDKTPILHHDGDLERMTGNPSLHSEVTAAEILELPAMHRERFGDRFADNRLSTLSDFAQWLSRYPDVTAFVEIKRQSVEVFGADTVVSAVLNVIEQIKKQVVIISFNAEAIEVSRILDSTVPIGWVLRQYDQQHHDRAKKLRPEYLFCKTVRLPEDRVVWDGPWQWVLYNTDSAAEAMDFFRSGFDMLETNRIVDLLGSEEFTDE